MSTSKRALLPGGASRPSTSTPRPPGPPIPPIEFSSSALISESAQLIGTFPVTLSSESVIHPRARIEAQAGSVHVGRRCIVHERAVVGAVGASGRVVAVGVKLGDYVTVETGATVEAGDTAVGEGTTVGAGTVVGAGAKVGKHCTLTAYTVIKAGEVVPDYTVVYSNGLRRVDRRGVEVLKQKAQARQIDVLRRLIPSKPEKFMPAAPKVKPPAQPQAS
ncbi:trimeric LpxA-like protein [Podospora conica]|nr:trimeric LpxA-like protein [Schizothecium conicum]